MPWQVSSQYALGIGVATVGNGMNTKLAEYVVALIVIVWLLSVAAALLDPERAEVAGQLAPIIGTIAGGAIAVLTIKRKNGNGKNGA